MSTRQHRCPHCGSSWHCDGCPVADEEKVCDECSNRRVEPVSDEIRDAIDAFEDACDGVSVRRKDLEAAIASALDSVKRERDAAVASEREWRLMLEANERSLKGTNNDAFRRGMEQAAKLMDRWAEAMRERLERTKAHPSLPDEAHRHLVASLEDTMFDRRNSAAAIRVEAKAEAEKNGVGDG